MTYLDRWGRWLTVLLLAGIVSSAQAVDIYVHNELGSDANLGTATSSLGIGDGPVRTIAAALRRVPNGGRVILLPTSTPYRESIVINGAAVRGFPNEPLIIEGNGVELLGDVPVDPLQWKYTRLGVYQLNRPATTHGMLFANGNPLAVADPFIGGGIPPVAPEHFLLHRGAYYFHVPEGKRLTDYQLSESAAGCGALIYRSSNVIVRNLKLRGFKIDAVQVRGPAEGIRIQNCLLANSGRAAVSAYTLSDVELENCFLTGNVEYGALAENSSQVYLKSCEVSGSRKETQSGLRSEVRVSGGDPQPLPESPTVIPPGMPSEAPPVQAAPQEPIPPQSPQPMEEKPKIKSFFD